MEARPAVLRGRRSAAPLQGHRSPHRVSRHDHGRAVDHGRALDQGAVRASRPRCRARGQHQPLSSRADRSRGSDRPRDRDGRTRERRRGVPRARPELGRLLPAARGLLPTRPRDLPIVGDVQGAGYFYGIELVKDKATRTSFNPEESERLLRGFLSRALYDAGLICRADDRGDPVVQLAPPLIIGQPEFDYIEQVLRTVLTEAWARI